VSDAELALVENQPAIQVDPVESAGLAKFGPIFPAGRDVKLGPVHDLTLPAAMGLDTKRFLDFDTGRRLGELEGGRRNSDRDYARWLISAGVDVQVQGDTLRGADVNAWIVDSALWDKLPSELSDLVTIDPGPRGPSDDFQPPRDAGGARLKPEALPATYLFTTREGGRGILQILSYSEQPKGFHIRYRMFESPRLPAATTVPSTRPIPTGLSFGPEQQVTLNDPRSDKDAALNLDTGKTLALPAGAYEAGYEKWLGSSDASVMVLPDSSRSILAAIRGKKISLRMVSPDAWDRLTPGEVIELAGRYASDPDLFQGLAIFPSLPQAGVFTTPKGTIGLLQITEANGVTGKTAHMELQEGRYPMSLKLRYKVVQPAARPAATQPNNKTGF
jgi:hypothetical protein